MIGNATNRLRISGMNSGMDTEAIVKAMSGATKLRINNNQRKVLKLQAQQNAYRDVISKLQNFQNTYFNVLNRNNFLKTSTIFNQTKATVYTNGEQKTPTGVTVTANSGANAATYDVKLLSNATQTTVQGANFGSSVKLDVSQITTAQAGDSFAFAVKVGNTTKNIAVEVGVGEGSIDAVNRALADAFGKASDGKGIVRIDNDGSVSATDKSSISISNVVKMDSIQVLTGYDFSGMISGTNELRIQIGDKVYTVPAIYTASSDEYDELFDSTGKYREGADLDKYLKDKTYSQLAEIGMTSPNEKAFNAALATITKEYEALKTEFEQVALDVAYEEWLKTATDADKEALYQQYFDIKLAEQVESRWTTSYNTELARAFNEARNDAYMSYLADFEAGGGNLANAVKEKDWVWKTEGDLISSSTWIDTDSGKTAYEAAKQTAYAQYVSTFGDPSDADSFEDWALTWDDAATWFASADGQTAYIQAREAAYVAAGGDIDDAVAFAAWEWKTDGEAITTKNWDWVANGGPIDWEEHRSNELAKADDSDSSIWVKVFTAEQNAAYNAAKVVAYNEAKEMAFDEAREAAYNTAKSNAYRTATGELPANADVLAAWTWNDSDSNPITLSNWTWKNANGDEITNATWTWRDSKNVAITANNWKWMDGNTEIKVEEWAQNTANWPYADVDALRAAAAFDPALQESIDERFANAFEPWLLDYDAYKSASYKESIAFKEITYANVGGLAAQNLSAEEAVIHFNQSNLKNTLEKLSLDGVKFEVEFDDDDTSPTYGQATISAYSIEKVKEMQSDGAGGEIEVEVEKRIDVSVAISSTNNSNNANVLGDGAFEMQTATINTSSTLASLGGIDFKADGTTIVNINGTNITLKSNMTINEMMSAVNNSEAGVTMTFSSLTNSFSVVSKAYGTDSNVELSDTNGFFARLGLDVNAVENAATKTDAQNLRISINNQIVETKDNKYSIDGTTFTFSATAEAWDEVKGTGTNFRVEVGANKGAAVDAIKNFVNDYNKLIEEIYGMLQEKPNKNYYFLTDDDIEEGGLSDRQIEQWESLSKKGMLYNDSAISSVMSGLRSAMMTMITGSDGKQFGIFNIRGNASSIGANDGAYGLRTSSDYKKNGMLEFDADALTEALERNPDDIIKLFTGTGGLMEKLEKELDRAVKISADESLQGSLIRRAGTATGLSSTNNALYHSIRSYNSIIDTLQARYDRQQDRYWKVYSNMEKQFASLNNQSGYITSLFNM